MRCPCRSYNLRLQGVALEFEAKAPKTPSIQNEKAKNVLDFPHTFLEAQLFAGKSTKSHLNSRSCWSSSGFGSLAQIQTKPEGSSKQWRLSSLCPLAKPPIITGWAPQYSKKRSLAKDEEHLKPSKTIQFHRVHPTHKHLSSYATQRFQGSFQDSRVTGFQGSRVLVLFRLLGSARTSVPLPDWNPTVTAVQIFAEGFHGFLLLGSTENLAHFHGMRPLSRRGFTASAPVDMLHNRKSYVRVNAPKWHQDDSSQQFLLGADTLSVPVSSRSNSGCAFPCFFVRQSTAMLGCGTHFTLVPVSAKVCLITCISNAVRLSPAIPVVSFDRWPNSDFASTIQTPRTSPGSLSSLANALSFRYSNDLSHCFRSNPGLINSLKTVTVHDNSPNPRDRLWVSAAKVEFATRWIFPDLQWRRLHFPSPFSKSSWSYAITAYAPWERPLLALAKLASVMTPHASLDISIGCTFRHRSARLLSWEMVLFKSKMSWTFKFARLDAMRLAIADASGRPSLAAHVMLPTAALVSSFSSGVAASSAFLPFCKGTGCNLSSTNFAYLPEIHLSH